MKVVLIGYGKMGQKIASLAGSLDIEIVAIISPNNVQATSKVITKKNCNGADVAIDFTTASICVQNTKLLADTGIPIVMGTTGITPYIHELKQITDSANIGFIWGNNFSLGVNIFSQVVKYASELINRFDFYDVGIIERHHKNKIDYPSGTALNLENILIESLTHKNTGLHCGEKPKDSQISVASLRTGSIPGTHSIVFDSEFDTIELTHTARSRDGFALGALLASKWIFQKKGFFEINDFIKEITF